MFSLICAWINAWVNNRDAGDLTRNRAHYDVTVMITCIYEFILMCWRNSEMTVVHIKFELSIIQYLPYARASKWYNPSSSKIQYNAWYILFLYNAAHNSPITISASTIYLHYLHELFRGFVSPHCLNYTFNIIYYCWVHPLRQPQVSFRLVQTMPVTQCAVMICSTLCVTVVQCTSLNT